MAFQDRVLDIALIPLGLARRSIRSGEKHSVVSRPGWDAPATITLTSTAYEDGGPIDRRHSAIGRGQNVSPQLSWSGVPEGTRQLVLVFEDVDLPFERPGLHTIGLLPPDLTSLREGELTPDHPLLRWVPVREDRLAGYSGPRPLPGHGPHHYRFHLFALDTEIPADAAIPDIDALDPHLAGHVVARGVLSGHQTG